MSTTPTSTNPPVVWLVSETFEPRGSSGYTLRLARHLSEYGFHPVIICESDQYIPTKLKPKLDIRIVKKMRSRLFGPAALRKLVHQSTRSPDLIHSQRQGLERIGDDLADAFDVPHVLTLHNYVENRTRLSVRPPDLSAFIVVSPSIQRDLLHKENVADPYVHLIPSGVDIPEPLRIPPPRDPEKIPVVGTASVLERSKGIVYFLMAAELILSSGHDVEFVIAGSGPEEETLRLAAQHLDIANRVTFAPHVTSFMPVIETFDVFVLPSLEQGLGTVMLEAMALGKPVVATKVGGVADFFVDGEHAIVVEKENHVVLSDKIEMLLDFPDKARKLAINGQNFVRERFHTQRMVADTANLYRQILQSLPIPLRN